MIKPISTRSLMLATTVAVLALLLSACSFPDALRTLQSIPQSGAKSAPPSVADVPTATEIAATADSGSDSGYGGGKTSLQLTLEGAMPLPTIDQSTLPPPAKVNVNADGSV